MGIRRTGVVWDRYAFCMVPLPPTRERQLQGAVQRRPLPDPATTVVVPGGAGHTPPPRRRRWVRVVLIVLAIMLAAALGAAATTFYVTKNEVEQLLTPKTKQTKEAQKKLAPPLPGRPVNVLVMGSDHRSGTDVTDKRSDTILLVRLDPKRKSISMLSFPRDLWVPIPGHGSAKINDAFSYGGPALTVQTIKDLTGLEIHNIAVIDFKGFKQLINTLGGVYVDVDRRYHHDNSLGGNFAEISVNEGYQLLSGDNALAYARFRHTDSDFHRIARQQQLLTGLKKQINASSVARNVPGLFDVVKRNTDMAAGGNGQVSTRQVIDYMRLALALKANGIYQVELNGGLGTAANGASIVEADQATIRAAVDQFLNPDKNAQNKTVSRIAGTGDAPGDTATDAGAADKKPQLPPPSRVRVEVRNGNNVPGAAGAGAAALKAAGYDSFAQRGTAGMADRQDYPVTRIQYANAADRALAERLAELIPGSMVMQRTAANQSDAKLLVIMGRKGEIRAGTSSSTAADNSVPVPETAKPESSRVPPPAKPAVVRDREYGLEEFRGLRGRTSVPLMYPTVREQGSTYEFPIRSYRILKGKTRYPAYRLVAKTSAGDYWGLQGTMWPDPPLLADPTREVSKGGRTYMLYFNGTKLHRVAWRQDGATYWVTNSLLDKLSNETMMAIAVGIRPVPRRR